MARKFNYLIIGAGGTGGVLAHAMSKAGLYVTLIARGEHLRAIRANGLTIRRLWDETSECMHIKATDMDHYSERPDVIFLCVKDYSLEGCYDFIRNAAKKNTVIIPLLNGISIGRRISEALPGYTVPAGLIYVSANIAEPGFLVQYGSILKIIFGMQDAKEDDRRVREIAEDLVSRGINAVFSEKIRCDILEKFSYVSPAAAAGLYLGARAGDFQKPGEPREMFKTMIREIMALAYAMGCPFGRDFVRENLRIMNTLKPTASTSLQRDIEAGKPSEIDSLIGEVLRLGEEYHVPMPAYKMAAEEIQKRYGLL